VDFFAKKKIFMINFPNITKASTGTFILLVMREASRVGCLAQ
jgi:hypothetical protein